MAHEIDRSTGADAIAYRRAGGRPWHGLGAALDDGQPIETWVQAARLEWEAKLGRVFVADGRRARREAPEYRMVYRSDTRKRFAVVSPRYEPMQPREVLEFFRDLADSYGFRLETAGALKEGAIVWALAGTKHKINIGMNDIVKPYLLASTSYDGSQAHRWCFTTVRVVCNNTLRLSYAKDSQGVVTIRHIGKVDKNEVKRRLRLLDEQVETFEARAKRLAEFRPSRAEVERLLTDMFGKQDEKGRLTAHSLSVIEDIKKAIDASPGADLASASGTVWGVLNGVTRYIDFEARARSNDNRLTSAWFGRGDQLKGKVMDRLLGMAA